MAIPRAGTFDYVAVVPESGRDQALWDVQIRVPIELTGDDHTDARLVGRAPTLEISDAGMTPDVRVSAITGIVGPRVLRSRLTLRATTRQYATIAECSFHVDRVLTSRLLPSDQLFMARTGCGGLALSIVRGGQLVAAAGALSAVPLGENVRVSIPFEAGQAAERAFQEHDPTFELHEWPVEIRVGEHKLIRYSARPRLDMYDVYLAHGFFLDTPGTSECLAISLRGAIPDTAAIASAQLMDFPTALEMVLW